MYPVYDKCGCIFDDHDTLALACEPVNTVTYHALLFMYIIETIVKSSCSITDPCRRVKPVATPNSRIYDDDEFDFIVLGAGVAGSVVAARLSENPNFRVLLIEAGPEEPTTTSIPAFAFTGLGTHLDWKFQTVPQKRACLSTAGICQWPRGKMICGTGCLSGMMYTRGNAAIYNQWAKEGNHGWGYEDVLHYFKKAENNTEPADKIEPEYHGFDGPLTVSRFSHCPELAPDILAAARELGFHERDLNGSEQVGFTVAPVMVKDGIRASTSRMYLRPALKRKNLRVLIESMATKILFEGNKAVAVEFMDKWGNVRKMFAKKEIILSAGVVGSAQLLMHSGVGPASDLKRLGIKVVRNLPVGRAVHHHVGIGLAAKIIGPINDSLTMKALNSFLETRSGPFTSTGLTQLTAFIKSSYAKHDNVPDLQLYVDGYNAKCSTYESRDTKMTINFRPTFLLSKCRGTIKLKSANPLHKPIIDPNYLCEDHDINVLVDAIHTLQNLTSTESLRPRVLDVDAENNENCLHLKETNPMEYWRCIVQQYTLGENHHAGSCKMGPKNDPYAVVDSRLRVYGIPNLRVIDASILPSPINCNTIGPTIMVAEKGSDMIVQTWSKKIMHDSTDVLI